MVFSGIPFLYYFLPVFFILYYALPKKCRNVVLVLFSLVFYGWGEPVYILLMAASIIASYFFGLLIGHFALSSVSVPATALKKTASAQTEEKAPSGGEAASQKASPLPRLFLILSITVHVGVLLYFKYTDFVIGSVNSVTSLDLPLRKIALPLGISFYTFQILSYLIDLYYGRISVQKNFIHYAAYVSMFPQLVAGPIVRYQEIEASLRERRITSADLACGITRFVTGLSKKVVLADNLGKLEGHYLSTTQPSVLYAWLYAVSFTLQIYFDFSGYSDMAIGLGRMLGFHFPENFDHPYESRSITEFWRRWHMTLGGWFRDYIYIPLGGNRVPRGRFIRNILVVWALTGLWHGAAWNFVLWGLYYGVLLLLEKFFWKKFLEKNHPAIRVFSHVYMVLATIFGFVLFNSPTLARTGSTLLAMLGLRSYPALSAESIYYLRNDLVLFLLALIFSTSLPGRLLGKIKAAFQNCQSTVYRALYLLWGIIRIAVLFGLFLLCTAYIVDENFHPFLYFRF